MKLSSTMMNDVDFERRVKDAFLYFICIESGRLDVPLVVDRFWKDFCIDNYNFNDELLFAMSFISKRLNIDFDTLDERRKYFNLSFFSEEEKE